MDRHYILPVTIAAALHAGLLFGSRRGAVPAPVIAVIEASTGITIPPPLPDEPEPVAELPDKGPKGSPVDTVPTTVDVSPPSPTALIMPLPPVLPAAIVNRDKIPSGPFGQADGKEGAPYANAKFISLTDLDNTPRTRTQVAPPYPFEAKRNGQQGEVLVEFTVDENGRVSDPRVVRSSDRIFEEPTLRAIVKWRFEPGMKSGRAVRFRMAAPVVFSLNNE